MLEGTIRTGIILVWLLIALGSNPSFAQTITVGGAPRPFTELTLEISAPMQGLLRLQPIPLVIRQVNRGDQPVFGYNSVTFTSAISLYVRKNNEPELEVTPLSPISGLFGRSHSEVPPGGGSLANEWLTINLSKYFAEPGNYELRAVLYNADRTQSVESNRITIEIHEPAGTDRMVYNLIRDSSYRDYLFSGAEFLKVKSTLEQITTRYPNSSYAKSAFFVLGEAHLHRRELASALVNLTRLEHDDTFLHAAKVRRYLAEIRAAQAQ